MYQYFISDSNGFSEENKNLFSKLCKPQIDKQLNDEIKKKRDKQGIIGVTNITQKQFSRIQDEINKIKDIFPDNKEAVKEYINTYKNR